jgi:hypothetical protein
MTEKRDWHAWSTPEQIAFKSELVKLGAPDRRDVESTVYSAIHDCIEDAIYDLDDDQDPRPTVRDLCNDFVELAQALHNRIALKAPNG